MSTIFTEAVAKKHIKLNITHVLYITLVIYEHFMNIYRVESIKMLLPAFLIKSALGYMCY